MRFLWAAALILLSVCTAHAAPNCTDGDGAWIERACYADPLETGLYGHDVLGGTPEWTSVRVTLGPKGRAALGGTVYVRRVPARHIFEDIAPRIVQLDGSGPPELILIYTDFDRGAALMVDNLENGQASVTPHIGTRNRWLAPLGAADLDGDGYMELAYIDRPHLARTLVIWRYAHGGALVPVAKQAGLTNHRIGQDFITGGIADCGRGPEILSVDAAWETVLATRLSGGRLVTDPRGRYQGQRSIQQLAGCDPLG